MVDSIQTLESSESAISKPNNQNEQKLFQESAADGNAAQTVRDTELSRISQTSGAQLPEIALFNSNQELPVNFEPVNPLEMPVLALTSQEKPVIVDLPEYEELVAALISDRPEGDEITNALIGDLPIKITELIKITEPKPEEKFSDIPPSAGEPSNNVNQIVTRSFDFDREGNLKGFTENGDNWVRQKDGSYEKVGSNPAERRTNVQVGSDGSFTYKDEQTGQTVQERDDGSKLINNADGSSVNIDEFGRIDAIKYATVDGKEGAERFFDYDKETGELSGFQEAGEHWTRRKDGSFVKDGSNPEEVRSNVKVDPNSGEFQYKDEQTGQTITESPSGARQTKEPNGSFVVTDPKGRPIVVHREPNLFIPTSGGF